MFVKIFSSFKEFIKMPFGFLLTLICMIPVIFISGLGESLGTTLGLYAFTSEGILSLTYLLTAGFWLVVLYFLFALIGVFFNSLLSTVVLNYMLNKRNNTSNSLFSGLSIMFGLFFAVYIMFIVFAIFNLLIMSVWWLILIEFLMLILLFIVVIPRWFFVPILIIDKKERIRKAFSDSWELTKDKYGSILFFVILFTIVSSIISLLLVNYALFYSLGIAGSLVVEYLILWIIDSALVYWMLSVLFNSYK